VKDFLIIALGAATFKDIEGNSFGRIPIWRQDVLKYFELKYLELKYFEVEVSRVEVSRVEVFRSWSISSWSISKLKYFELKYDALHYILSLYSKKVFFDYSLGGYSHRERWARTRRYFLVKHSSWRTTEVLLPSGASFMVVETRIFSVKIWLRHEILELRYRNATQMPWLVTKVRPRDPSCVA
jgi:hypothetical protein